MVTYAPPRMLDLAHRLESAIASAVFSGIVPDGGHTWGFHCSPEDLGWDRDDYSLANDDNWFGAQLFPQWGAAFDMSMSPSDMTLVHGRIRASWADPNDDRLSLWYEHIGAINGNVSRLVSYEPEWGEYFDADGTHTWHEHTSARRSQLNNQIAMDSLYGVWTGQEIGERESAVSATDELIMAWNLGTDKTPNSGPCYLTTRQIRAEDFQRRTSEALQRLEAAVASGRQVALTDEQVNKLAAALVAIPSVPLGERDIPAVVAGVKQALREGAVIK